MIREGHDNAVFFIGPEVEHTPAYSKKTLFVVGKPELAQIELIANEHKVPHIFLGANHSFNVESKDLYWDKVITALLDKGFWVTLDYQAHDHGKVLEILNPGIWQSRIFVPLLSVRIPKFEVSSPNLTVKIDDIDFAATNPGIWCHHYHELMDSNRFTDWQDYGTDEVITSTSSIVPNPITTISNKATTRIQTDEGTSELPESVDLNLQDVGIDPNSPSQLKPDLNETQETDKNTEIPTTPELAAEAYAAGTTEDPLSAELSKKPVKKVSKK